MVGSDVQPDRCICAKTLRECKSKTRAFNHEGIDIFVDCRDERNIGVTDFGATLSGLSDESSNQHRRGRLAIGSSDRHDRSRAIWASLLPLVCDVDLTANCDSATMRLDDDRVIRSNARRRHQRISAAKHGLDAASIIGGVQR